MADQSGNCNFLWTPEIITELIESIQPVEYLWNPSHIYFKKKNLRRNAFSVILQDLRKRHPSIMSEVTEDDLMKKLNTLKNYFRKEQRKIRELKTGTNDDVQSQWCHFEKLSFMDSENKAEESIFTLALKSESPEEEDLPLDLEDSVLEQEHEPRPVSPVISTQSSYNFQSVPENSDVVDRSHQKKRKHTADDVMLNASKALQDIGKKNANYHFGQLVAFELDSMPNKLMQLKARKEMMEVLEKYL